MTRVLICMLLWSTSAFSQAEVSSVTVRGVWNAGSATRTAPFKIGTTAPLTCTVGDQFWDSDATAGSNLFSCTATNQWTLQAGAGASSIAGLTDARVTKTDGTHLAYSGGAGFCGVTRVTTSAIASITLASGTDGEVNVGVDCEDGGAIIVARGSTLDVSGSGFTESSLDNFLTRPRVQLIASIPVSGGAFGTVAEGRTFFRNQIPVPGDGLAESISVDGSQVLALDGTVIRKGTTIPGGFIVFGTGASSALQNTDDVAKVWRNTTGGAITLNNVYCAADSGAPTIQIQKDDGSVTNMLSSDLSCGTSEATTAAFVSGENILAAGDYIKFVTVNASAGGGSPTQVTLSFGYTRN
jgi:hypothetical protein